MNWTKNCRKIVCVGRNYAAHAKELNNPLPKSPMLFLKPPSSIVEHGGAIEVPPDVDTLHHEVELGVVIGKRGRDVSTNDAPSFIKGYFLGLDMTARNLQEDAKKAGAPWSVAKGYDTFAAVGPFIPANEVKDPSNLRLWLKVNSTPKQDGVTSDMIFNVPTLISYISTIFTLEDGDLIFTGTPAGVGPVKAGDVITGGLVEKADDGSEKVLSTISFDVINRPSKAKL